mmetsp:Transcript_46470/g.133830  ORF Transcript_46470/g.133830 Transcript_46470/m.133830 type:complete len:374 (+) Transcript_46470:82-1203(+)|eukprot:CAMPEP_0176043384 /NCGR_PEP_ID=MMETSP0120_2-20121206/21529_1 /TAXON_ID=160619 /ORGANISM="Kryptoperidinium foliaceum, Strain CCMP 1326" /LENGTH=373 /DNA_ID=CAMNT_0017376791 /DNA_START=77 /DNA_END=1198 /DNA_ORIENTATION=-
MCRGGVRQLFSVQPDIEAPRDFDAKRDAKAAAAASQSTALLLVAGHAICASGLLVVNKWALREFPFVWTLTTIQFLFAAFVTYTAGKMGIIHVDSLELGRLLHFFPAAGMFFITITAGNAVVGMSNVDTFIVMRSVVPIPCAILEAVVLKEPYPPPRSWVGLAIVLLGAVGFCLSNQGLLVGSAAWVFLYLALMPLDGVLIKQVVSSSGLSPWGLVLYNNVCAVIPGLFFSAVLELGYAPVAGAMSQTLAQRPALVGGPILLSCASGLAISYFQLNVRKVISSTAFMVLGVSNKILSVLLNQLAQLDSNGDLLSIGSVLASIFGAILFQQTVKGKGMSQAPQATDPKKGQLLAQAFVTMGLIAAAWISYAQRA